VTQDSPESDATPNADQTRSSDPGPTWMWTTAWSLQGVAVLGTAAAGIEGEFAQFMLMGVAAAVPLVGLNLILRNRPAS
jgi:hypothetical protein